MGLEMLAGHAVYVGTLAMDVQRGKGGCFWLAAFFVRRKNRPFDLISLGFSLGSQVSELPKGDRRCYVGVFKGQLSVWARPSFLFCRNQPANHTAFGV